MRAKGASRASTTARWFVLATVSVVACNWSQSSRPGSPPAIPTHHALVAGVVVGARGQPLDSISVGALTALSNPRAVSVGGGTTTRADGSYRFEVAATAPTTPDGSTDMYVRAFRYSTAGGKVAEDSVLVRISLVPLGDSARLTTAPVLKLAVQ